MSGPVYNDPTQSYNVPGNIYYREDLPLDFFVVSNQDAAAFPPGYAVTMDPDGTPVIVVHNGIDGVYTYNDTDGTPIISIQPDSKHSSIQTDPDGTPVFVGSF